MFDTEEMALYTTTPLLESTQLSQLLGSPVYLKLENTQPSGPFSFTTIKTFLHKSYVDKDSLLIEIDKIFKLSAIGSFKIRGIGMKCWKEVKERHCRHLISSSGGTH